MIEQISATEFQDRVSPFYAILINTTTARTNAKIDVPGFTFLYVDKDTTATGVRLRFNDENSQEFQVDVGDSLQLPFGVRKIYVTHSAQPGNIFRAIVSATATIRPAAASISTIGSVGSISNPVEVYSPESPVNQRVAVFTNGVPAENGVKVLGFGVGDSITTRGNQGSGSDAVKVYSVASQPNHVAAATGSGFTEPFSNMIHTKMRNLTTGAHTVGWGAGNQVSVIETSVAAGARIRIYHVAIINAVSAAAPNDLLQFELGVVPGAGVVTSEWAMGEMTYIGGANGWAKVADWETRQLYSTVVENNEGTARAFQIRKENVNGSLNGATMRIYYEVL